MDPTNTPAALIAPGSLTSEFKLARLAFIVGTMLEGLTGILEQLQHLGIFPAGGRGDHAVSIALVVAGALLQLCALLGYTRSRTAVKVAGLTLPAAPLEVLPPPVPTRVLEPTPEAKAAAAEVNAALSK